jgi:hypothetical protein
MGGARFGDPSPPHQLREAGARLDGCDALMFPSRWRAASGPEAAGRVGGEKVDRISLMGSRWRARSVAPALAPCPVLEGLVSSALGGDVPARPPLFCLHHFVDHRPKILTGFLP